MSLTSSLVLALAYKRVVSGIVTLVSGVAITEAQVFTRPTAAIDDWRAYQQGAWAGGNADDGHGGSGNRGAWSQEPGGLGVMAVCSQESERARSVGSVPPSGRRQKPSTVAG